MSGGAGTARLGWPMPRASWGCPAIGLSRDCAWLLDLKGLAILASARLTENLRGLVSILGWILRGVERLVKGECDECDATRGNKVNLAACVGTVGAVSCRIETKRQIKVSTVHVNQAQ
jgi:hypothetical protein